MPKKNEELEPVQPKIESVSENTPVDEVKTEKVSETTEKPAAAAKPEVKPETVAAEKTGGVEPVKTPKASKPLDAKALAVKAGIGLVAVMAVVVTAFGVLIYGYQSESPVVKTAAGIMPYPAEKVNGSFVSYSDYLFEVDANKRAYQNNAKLNNQPAVDFNSADGQKMLKEIRQHALDKLKSDAVVAQLARENKVSVSEKEANDLINELYKRYGGKDTLLKTLKQIYGWDLADLKKVVRKQLLAQKLEDKVTSDPKVQEQAKAKAQDVLNKVKAGGDFAELAKQYSQAADASTGGDLGSVTKGQLPDEQQKAIDALQVGQVSDLVKTQYGYEIIRVTEKNGDTAKVMHILIKTIDFNDYFSEQIEKAKTKTYITVK